MSLWLKRDEFHQYCPIVAATNDFVSGKWLNLTTYGDKNASYIWSRREDKDLWPYVYKENVFELNKWQHIIISVDASVPGSETGTVRASLYIDGVKVSQGDVTDGLLENGGAFYIGANAWTADGYLKGLVSDVRIYTRSLDAAEAAAVYENSLYGGYSLTVSRNGENVDVKINGTLPLGKTLIAAAYKGGKLAQVKAVTVEKDSYSFSLPEDAEIKVFLWNTLSGLSPEKAEITYNA